jgi:hypothetical protein
MLTIDGSHKGLDGRHPPDWSELLAPIRLQQIGTQQIRLQQ